MDYLDETINQIIADTGICEDENEIKEGIINCYENKTNKIYFTFDKQNENFVFGSHLFIAEINEKNGNKKEPYFICEINENNCNHCFDRIHPEEKFCCEKCENAMTETTKNLEYQFM